MRIIAGTFRGRRLLPPATDSTRPITDRVKQSLFDILAPAIPGAVVYDCFAGTGSMGLESLSRGAACAVFFESDRAAVALLRKNIAAMQVDNVSTVIADDVFRHFNSGFQIDSKADLVFLDPPYRFLHERPDPLRQLAQSIQRRLQPTGTVIFRHDAADTLDLPGLAAYDTRTYGSMTLKLLHPAT